MSRNLARQRFALPARLLHWVVALAIPGQIYLGWVAELGPTREAGSRLLQLHYQFGVTVAILMLLRLLWRIAFGAPEPLVDGPLWERRVAAITHFAIYALLLLLPASGYTIWVWMNAPMDVFGLFELPRFFTPPTEDETGRALAWYVHFWTGWTLIVLIALHVGAALWHQFVRRDDLIRRRML